MQGKNRSEGRHGETERMKEIKEKGKRRGWKKLKVWTNEGKVRKIWKKRKKNKRRKKYEGN